MWNKKSESDEIKTVDASDVPLSDTVVPVADPALATPTSPIITIDCDQLPVARIGQLYDFKIKSSGGRAPHTFQIVAGNLPGGLGLYHNGVLAGNPQHNSVNSFAITVEARDQDGNRGQKVLTLELR